MAELTATMRLCIDSIEQAPGTLAKELPGGTQTVLALMRRGLVEIQGEKWGVFLPAHRHTFVTGMHADGCHFFTTDAHCDCGVGLHFLGERSLKSDPWSAMWMADDEGAPQCVRCQQLYDGARPKYEQTIYRPEGYTPPLEAVA